MKLYVCGPMAGLKDHNFPAFKRAREELRSIGYEVTCPAELGKTEGWSWEDYLKRDIKVLVDCDGVATLPGIENSRGASLEIYISTALRIPVKKVSAWVTYSSKY